MTRQLRPAAEMVSDIGALGFALQHHSEAEIAHAVNFCRMVNPEMFDWLSKLLAGIPPPSDRREHGAQEPTDKSTKI